MDYGQFCWLWFLAQRNSSERRDPLGTSFSPVCLDYTYLEPGRGSLSMRPCFQFWPLINEDNSEDTKTMTLLMSVWLHQTPQGPGVISVECDVHDTVQHFWALLNAQQHWSVPLFAVTWLWFALWLHESPLSSCTHSALSCEKVLHPSNVN